MPFQGNFKILKTLSKIQKIRCWGPFFNNKCIFGSPGFLRIPTGTHQGLTRARVQLLGLHIAGKTGPRYSVTVGGNPAHPVTLVGKPSTSGHSRGKGGQISGHRHHISGHRATKSGHRPTKSGHRPTKSGHGRTKSGHKPTKAAHRPTISGHSTGKPHPLPNPCARFPPEGETERLQHARPLREGRRTITARTSARFDHALGCLHSGLFLWLCV